MIYWKWSNGEVYYKSPRKNTSTSINTIKSINTNNEDNSTTLHTNYDSAQNAIAQSLAFTNINDPNFTGNNDYNNDNNNYNNDNENKREYIDNKISDREMISQRGTNPFSIQTSYVNDVVTRDMFLKPINTTQGRTKNQNKTEE